MTYVHSKLSQTFISLFLFHLWIMWLHLESRIFLHINLISYWTKLLLYDCKLFFSLDSSFSIGTLTSLIKDTMLLIRYSTLRMTTTTLPEPNSLKCPIIKWYIILYCKFNKTTYLTVCSKSCKPVCRIAAAFRLS